MPVPVVLGNEAIFDDEDSIECGDTPAVEALHQLLAGADVLVSVLVLARVLVGQRH